ncbi:MAG: PaaI family thioesterase [Gemmatimonadaceae bacterium]
MHTLGATLARVAPGEVDIALRFREELTQQHGLLHAGVTTAVMDSACGYAALTLMEVGAAVLSVEFKVQLLAPARGTEFVARGRVVRSGRTLTVVAGEIRADGGEPVALLNGTMMAVRDRADLAD